LGALVGRLADDARAYADAEANFYRTLAAKRLGEARVGLVLGGVAALLALAAAIALIVGLVLALATLVGPGAATLIVVLITAAIAAGLGLARLSPACRHVQGRTMTSARRRRDRPKPNARGACAAVCHV